MKKLALCMTALLFLAGVVYAHTVTYDPQNKMTYVAVPVYNNSGAELDPGDVVIWDVGSSTGDDDAYVTTTTTNDTSIVAGVVWPASISAADTGSIVVWGLAECDTNTGGIGDAGVLCTSTTAGAGRGCVDDAGKYAVAAAAGGASSQVKCVVNVD